jgi:hypothetical protein
MSVRRCKKRIPEQIVCKFQMLVEGEDVTAICCHLELSKQTYYR